MCKVKLVKKIFKKMVFWEEATLELHTEISIEPFVGLVLLVGKTEELIEKVICPIGMDHMHYAEPVIQPNGHYSHHAPCTVKTKSVGKEVVCQIKPEVAENLDDMIEQHEKRGWKDQCKLKSHTLTINDLPGKIW